tara:strand:- start:10075 stop:10974 length:900 start_codon:yes stop_codon:yes gene_type:complete
MKFNHKKKYLNPIEIAKLNNISIKAKFVVEGYLLGLHKSPYHGYSVEFAEHRSYEAGDEIKKIDWKLFGKTDRYYIKEYEEETNLRSYIILDTSKSMNFSNASISKLDYGSLIASSLSYLMLKQRDAVSLTLFDEKIKDFIPPKSNPNHINLIFSKLDKIISGNNTNISTILHELALKLKQRGLIILISDLLDNPKEILSGLKHFLYNKHEIIVFHLFNPKELNLDFSSRIKFKDLETGKEITTDPWLIKSDYEELTNEFQNYYKKEMGNNKIDYIQLSTEQSLGFALNKYLSKRKACS